MRKLQPHQRTMLFALLACIVIGFLPIVRVLIIPIDYLDTHFHELGHALAAVGSGGSVEHIVVRWDGSGETPVSSDQRVLVGSAGYLFAMIVGGLTILFAKNARGAQLTLRTLAIVLAISTVVWVRPQGVEMINTAGIPTGIFWVVALWILGSLKADKVVFAAQFLGIQQCLQALRSVAYLVSVGSSVPSDATIVSNATGLPPIFWSVAWAGASLVVGALCLKLAWSAPRPESA